MGERLRGWPRAAGLTALLAVVFAPVLTASAPPASLSTAAPATTAIQPSHDAEARTIGEPAAYHGSQEAPVTNPVAAPFPRVSPSRRPRVKPGSPGTFPAPMAIPFSMATPPVTPGAKGPGHVLARVVEHKYELIVGSGAGPMFYAGGNVEKNPKVYVTYWGWNSDPAGMRPYLNSFFEGVGGSPWANIQTQYGDGGGKITNPPAQLKGTWDDNASVPPVLIPDADMAAEALRAVQHFGYDADAQYVIATPTGHGTRGFNSTGGYCAWHDSLVDNGRPVAYTNLPYIPDAGASCGAGWINSPGALDGVSIVAGHEYAESVTDPFPNSGWSDALNQENGDKCAWISVGRGRTQAVTLSTGTFPLQSLYSNAARLGAGDCVIAY